MRPNLNPTDVGAAPVWLVGGVLLAAAALFAFSRRRRRGEPSAAPPGVFLRGTLIAVATAMAVGVAVLGGVRSFEAVSERFGSPLVPLTADGMIVACTALRIAALTRGWRLPGAMATTYGFIGGTVWLNVAAADGWTAAVAHALAPISYAVLVEMLAHLLRLHLRLATPARQRVAALTWATSPIVTTRVWLHLARTGTDDPVAARALVQQVVRMSSRLRSVCPSPRWWPFGQARRARSAALQTLRDGLLSARDLADLLPADDITLAPGALLARVDKAALQRTTGCTSAAIPERTKATAPDRTGAPGPIRTSAATAAGSGDGTGVAAPSPNDVQASRRRTADRSDEELVAELRRLGGPMSGRQVMRLLGVGTPRAKRLVEMAGWTTKPPRPSVNGSQVERARDPYPTHHDDEFKSRVEASQDQ